MRSLSCNYDLFADLARFQRVPFVLTKIRSVSAKAVKLIPQTPFRRRIKHA